MKNHKAKLNLILLTSFLCSIGSYKPAQADETENVHNREDDVPVIEDRESQGTFFKFSENYFGIFVGNVQLVDSLVTTEQNCFGCSPPRIATQKVQFNKRNFLGIRGGRWGENFGYAIEFSNTDASNRADLNGSDVSVRYVALSFVPMLRTNSFKTSLIPSGLLNVYGGYGISFYSGNVDVYFPGLQNKISGQAYGSGPIALIGASLSYARSTFFVERRSRHTDLSHHPSELFGDSATVSIKATEIVFGMAYRY